VEFTADPSLIDYQQTVTLRWRAVDADGVYLLIGQTKRLTLGPVSDPDNPFTLQLEHGETYAMKAFQNQGGEPVTSLAVPLTFTFNAIVFQDFSADPPYVGVDQQRVADVQRR